jgi:hypothetical protein
MSVNFLESSIATANVASLNEDFENTMYNAHSMYSTCE